MNDPILVCAFCGTALPRSEAQEHGWVPYFFVSAVVKWMEEPETVESDKPACEQCAAEHLDDLDSDPILKPGHERFYSE
jgi:hypothetical protein